MKEIRMDWDTYQKEKNADKRVAARDERFEIMQYFKSEATDEVFFDSEIPQCYIWEYLRKVKRSLKTD